MRWIAAHPALVNILLLVLALLASVAVGSVLIPPLAIFDVLRLRLGGASLPPNLEPYAAILFSLRLPRTILAALTGAALAGSGAGYQGLFRNPLADPYLLGVASGAGLGAVVVMSLRLPYGWFSLLAVPLAAFLSAAATVFVVYLLARSGRTLPTTNLILAGVAVSSFAGALTSFLMLYSTGELRRALVWLLGGAASSGWEPVLGMLPYVSLGLGILLTRGHALNVLQFGDEQAQQLGIPVEMVRGVVIAAVSLATAAAVAFSGVIGFVGLIVPHLVRLVWGSDYRRLLPISCLLGASFLLFADILARIALAPQELPVGIVTALAGAPFFLWLLRRTRAQQAW
ncbi:MAG TPA: iron ABC transporter permease [Anaerolineaceae bacterium]